MRSDRYSIGITMLLGAVKHSNSAPASNHKTEDQDLVGIFAVLAAREFKYLLDAQAPNTLFFPGARRLGITDARQSRTYREASDLLDLAVANIQQGPASHSSAFGGSPTFRCVVTNGTADTPPDVLELYADIKTALVGIGLDIVDESCDSGKDGRLLEFGISRFGQVDQSIEPVESQRKIIHESVSNKVDGEPLCHGQTLVDSLMLLAFDPALCRTRRSAAYMAGARAYLTFCLTGSGSICAYDPGSDAFDAYHAGIDEGRTIWTRHQAKAAQ